VQAGAALAVGSGPASEAVCSTVVEVVTGGAARLVCAVGDSSLAACRLAEQPQAGDRIEDCVVEPGGMKPASRLLVGLPLDVNRVDAETLRLLRGIGPSTANAIVAYRASVGGFTEIEELIHIKGMGPKKLHALREVLAVLSEPSTP